MSGTRTPDVPDTLDVVEAAAPHPEQTMLLHAERVTLSKRVRRTLVRASRTTSTREEAVKAELSHEHVVVERVAVGRVVEVVPPVRQEGDVTIMPVVEEELVMVRRLVLKEEVHLRRVRTTTTHSETVAVREQHVAVTRTVLDD